MKNQKSWPDGYIMDLNEAERCDRMARWWMRGAVALAIILGSLILRAL